MKKFILVFTIFLVTLVKADIKIMVSAPKSFTEKNAILYTLDGSKDIIHSKKVRSGDSWEFKLNDNYKGMIKVYFPDVNYSFLAISEGKDVMIQLSTKDNKITGVRYLDQSNMLLEQVQDLQKKNENIFPALVQIREYYQPGSDFGVALDKEIKRLNEKVEISAEKNPFVHFYHTNYNKFLVNTSLQTSPTQDEIVDFFNKSNEMLETSSLIRPILYDYLNQSKGGNVEQAVSKLLTALNVETPRGQTVLSELIELFDLSGLTELKSKYLSEASALKCTINDRLASTINANKNTEIGAVFPDYKFSANVIGTIDKTLHKVNASKKLIIFWSSTCSHCEREIPTILDKYTQLKGLGVQVIGLSLDTDEESYKQKVNTLPWINDSELKGWYSSYADTYNIFGTPTYFILDQDNKIIAKPNHASDALQFLKLK